MLRAAAELGFIPDHSAVRLRTGRSNLIGAIINDINNPFFSELVSEFEIAAWRAGYLTILATSQDDPERQRQLIFSMIAQGVAGMIISPVHGSDASLLRPLKLRSIPYLICVRDVGDCEAGLVAADDFHAGFLAGQHILRNGHRHLAFVGGYRHTATWRRRREGISAAIAETDLGNIVVEEFCGSEGPEFGRRMVAELIARPEPPSAVIGLNDDTAIGAYLAAHDADLRIGKDISVIGFDNIPQSRTLLPEMTTVELFPRRMGFECAEQLKNFLSGATEKLEKISLEPVLIERGSVARI